VDARLVKSASKPLSNDDLRSGKEKRDTPEGKRDKDGNVLKFSRDVQSDWSIPCGINHVLCLCSEKP
jgi:IS5 family transposase